MGRLANSAKQSQDRGAAEGASSLVLKLMAPEAPRAQEQPGGSMSKKAFVASFLVAGLALSGAAQALTLTSPDIKPGARIADEQVYSGCGGKNVSPALSWSGAPKGTKSFALSVYDPDAPTGSGFWHWVVFNIPPDVTSLPKGAGDPKSDAAPKGAVQSRTDFGAPGYGGRARPRATNRTTITSRSSHWTRTRSTPTKTLLRPWSASTFTSIRSRRRRSRACGGTEARA
jgi:Raf kinase inhibitor-like YbhB/YbcL family protein